MPSLSTSTLTPISFLSSLCPHALFFFLKLSESTRCCLYLHGGRDLYLSTAAAFLKKIKLIPPFWNAFNCQEQGL